MKYTQVDLLAKKSPKAAKASATKRLLKASKAPITKMSVSTRLITPNQQDDLLSKSQNLGQPDKDLQEVDSIATSPIGCCSSDKYRDNEGELRLPIETWALGTRVIESVTSGVPQPQHWFCVRGTNISVLNASTRQSTPMFDFELGADINRVEVTSRSARHHLH